jgi:hypothetical protein
MRDDEGDLETLQDADEARDEVIRVVCVLPG